MEIEWTDSDEKELESLRELANNHSRWLSQEEFERIQELVKKKIEYQNTIEKP